MKNLPIGLSSFREVRERDVVYVDKTRVIHQLISTGKYYFLARPRRFGKSLTISTIAEIYSGSRELFKGLWIEGKWNWEKVHPVVHLSFNGLNYNDLGLRKALFNEMQRIATAHDIASDAEDAATLFQDILRTLSATKGKVVVLIDEYDKPMTDFLEKEKLPKALENRDILRGFYGVIKNSDPYLEFFFMTGVSKFSQVNLFSQLNNLLDISLHPNFSTLTGYTQTEFEYSFKEWIDHVANQTPDTSREELLQNIKKWYDGYTFDCKNYVYNPYSVLLFLSSGLFQDHWFKSGNPLFLINILKEKQFFILNDLHVSVAAFESFDLENIDPRALLFQTGYLTLKSANYLLNEIVLDLPNHEVERSLNDHLIGALLNQYAANSNTPVLDIRAAFLKNDLKKVVQVINSLLKDVPYNLFRGKKEAFYHALVHLHFRYLGIYLQSEVHTSDGRLDAVVQTNSHVYIFEFKINETGETAFQQILEKEYAEKYRSLAPEKTIIGVGIGFDTRRKKVREDWKFDLI